MMVHAVSFVSQECQCFLRQRRAIEVLRLFERFQLLTSLYFSSRKSGVCTSAATR